MGPPRRVRIFVWCVVALAIIASGIVFGAITSGPSERDLFTALILAALIGLARAYPVQLAERTQIAVDHAAAFAAVLLLPAYLAMVATAIGLIAASVFRPSIVLQHAFNISVSVLSVAAGAAVVHMFLPQDPVKARDLPFILTALLAIVAMWSTNVLLVDAVVAIQQRRRLFERWWQVNRQAFWPQASLYLLGMLMVAAPAQRTWALALLILPSFVVYRALRDGVALKIQTRLALQDLADIVDLRDRYTHDHCRRVAETSQLLARRLGYPPDEVDRIYLAARVHDVGKIGIKSTVLLKPGDLTEVEWMEMRSHPEIGAQIMEKFPDFRAGRELVLSHHERWDGSGYPRGLAGEAIPTGARVIAVADAWDAMTSNRAYRQAVDLSHAFSEMERGRGTQFEPRTVEAFLALLRERPELAQRHTEYTQDADATPSPRLSTT